jgi:glutaredoxin-dependent peroxiredoxin
VFSKSKTNLIAVNKAVDKKFRWRYKSGLYIYQVIQLKLIRIFVPISNKNKTMNVGQIAPDFTLYNTEKKEVKLSQYKGEKNILILFFPFAFTGTCTKELCGVRDDISRYSKINAEVLAISVDSPFTLIRYREEQNLPFQLLSDFNKEASTAYNTIYETFALNTHGVSKRSAFVIDKEGVIRYSEILENASEIPDFTKINETLEGLN